MEKRPRLVPPGRCSVIVHQQPRASRAYVKQSLRTKVPAAWVGLSTSHVYIEHVLSTSVPKERMTSFFYAAIAASHLLIEPTNIVRVIRRDAFLGTRRARPLLVAPSNLENRTAANVQLL